jgi:hypothetical protein
MNHKVFRSVFILAVGLVMASVMVRMKGAPSLPAPARENAHADAMARPLSSFRVYEDKISPDGIDFRGGNFKARVAEDGCVFGGVPEQGSVWASREFNLELGAPRIEQGSLRLECTRGRFSRPAFGVARLDRGAVIEEYLFENLRVEQLFRIPAALAEGALRLSIPVKSDLGGPVVAHAPHQDSFMSFQFLKGGLDFRDTAGTTKLAYHSAVAIDAEGREIALLPRHENGEIVLEIPAKFMSQATYPVVIDPWLDFLGSGTGGGVSQRTNAHSENPVVALTDGGQPFICWADDSAATAALPNNTDIYLKWWNGFEFFPLGTSMTPGGISQTPGKSSHPSLSLGNTGSPVVAWEDDTSGAVAILLREWPLKNEPGAGSWTELAGSGTNQGLSLNFSPALHPTVTNIVGLIPGVLTVDSGGNVTGATPSTTVQCPVVAYDIPFAGATQIVCQAFYPGAPAEPAAGGLKPTPAVPAGWYPVGLLGGLGVKNTFISSASNTPTGFVSQYPSIFADVLGRISLAWQDTRNGNYEIFFITFVYSGGGNLFQVVADPTNPLTQLNMLPAGDFFQIGSSASGGGVSNTATPSQFPSLVGDGVGGTRNFTIAWQETEAALPPNPGTTSQIYVARSVNAGAFAGLAGSTTTGGISKTLNHASAPSLDVNGNYIGVAWADDSNSRSSIYVRRMFLGVGGSGLWDQVGFQGSAFPTINAETFAPIGGISLSSNFSIQPSLKLDQFGSPIVAWADGSASTFDIRVKVFSPNGPGIAVGIGTNTPTFQTTLRQTLTDPTLGAATDVPLAGFVNGTTAFLSSRVFTETLFPAGTSLTLELEILPQGAPFTNSPNAQALFVAPDNPVLTPANIAVFKFDGLPNANYHWQGRTVDQIGRSSPWIIFPTDSSGASFRVNVNAPPGSGGPPVNGPPNSTSTSGSTPHRGQCGLTGLEGILLLGAIRLIRRGRTKK